MYWDEEFLHAFPDDLLKTLEFCEDKYGSINNFLHINGFTNPKISQDMSSTALSSHDGSNICVSTKSI